MAHAGPPPKEPDPEDAMPIEPDVPDEMGADAAMNVGLPATGAAVDEEPLPAPTIHDAPPELLEHVEQEERAALGPSPDLVTDGEVIRTLEWYIPVVWVGMLMIVCYIGIYYAVEKLPGGNPLPPSFQF
jgi:hypothetical protein